MTSGTPPNATLLPNFDRIAHVYRWAEYLALGPLLKRTRDHFLPRLARCRRALLLGDGDGRFAAALLAANPALHALAVDNSSAMLHLLLRRCRGVGAAQRIQVLHASLLTVRAHPETDLVVTHFVLDCLRQPEVNGLVTRLSAELRPGTLWLLSDFGYPRPHFARVLATAYIRLLYAAFRLLTGLQPKQLPDPQAALKAAGFRLVARKQRFGGFVYSELWQYVGCSYATPTPAHTSTKR